MISNNAPEELQPGWPVDAEPPGDDPGPADAEAGGAALEPQRVLAGQAAACRRWAALRQAGRRGPLRGDLAATVDEGPAAHLNERVVIAVQVVPDSKGAKAKSFALFSFCVRNRHLSLYIDIYQLDKV